MFYPTSLLHFSFILAHQVWRQRQPGPSWPSPTAQTRGTVFLSWLFNWSAGHTWRWLKLDPTLCFKNIFWFIFFLVRSRYICWLKPVSFARLVLRRDEAKAFLDRTHAYKDSLIWLEFFLKWRLSVLVASVVFILYLTWHVMSIWHQLGWIMLILLRAHVHIALRTTARSIVSRPIFVLAKRAMIYLRGIMLLQTNKSMFTRLIP